MVWSELIHLGLNEWYDQPRVVKWKNLDDPVLAKAVARQYVAADHVRFDEGVWLRVSDRFPTCGVNQVVIDLGEAVVYPSHPEIGVRGAWSADKLRDEARRLRSLGMEPIPKLNFSTTHDLWLGEYHRMVSSRTYYQVVSDIIRDVCEIFETPRFFHLGLDEESAAHQPGQSMVVVRQGDLWWHDVLFYIREVENLGMRAWVWNDFLRTKPREEFVRRMPRSVVQSPWSYCGEVVKRPESKQKLAIDALAELGYDTVPCASTCYGYTNGLPELAAYCVRKFDPDHLLGFQMAPWLEMNAVFEKRWGESADQVALARAAASTCM